MLQRRFVVRKGSILVGVHKLPASEIYGNKTFSLSIDVRPVPADM